MRANCFLLEFFSLENLVPDVGATVGNSNVQGLGGCMLRSSVLIIIDGASGLIIVGHNTIDHSILNLTLRLRVLGLLWVHLITLGRHSLALGMVLLGSVLVEMGIEARSLLDLIIILGELELGGLVISVDS